MRRGLYFAERALAGALVAYLFAAPSLGMELYGMTSLWYISYFVALAACWNMLGGLTGQVSFGYSAFVGLGAYTTGLLWLNKVNPYLTLPLGGLLAAAFSVLFGLPTFRLRGPYFTIATIGVSEAMRVLATAQGWAGGSGGKRLPAAFAPSVEANYYAMLALAVVVLAVLRWIQVSRFGLGLRAIREEIDAAESLGVDSTRFKLYVHAISAFFAAVAGGLFAMQSLFINPDTVFGFQLSLSLVLMPVIGGVGTFWGPVTGGVFYAYVQQQLQQIEALRNLHLLTYGLILVLIIMYEPGGVAGLWHRLVGRRLLRIGSPGANAAAASGPTGRANA